MLPLQLRRKTSRPAPLKNLYFFRDLGPRESCRNTTVSPDTAVPQAGFPKWDQIPRQLLGTTACFSLRRAECYFFPKTLKRLFSRRHSSPLRNLRGWTLHEIMHIKYRCPSPNRFSIQNIFSGVRSFQKAWDNSYSNFYQYWHWKHTCYFINTRDTTSLKSSAHTGHCTERKLTHHCPKDFTLYKIMAKKEKKSFSHTHS